MNKTKEALVREWFYNVAHSVKNEIILILEYQENIDELSKAIKSNLGECYQNLFFYGKASRLDHLSFENKSMIIAIPQYGDCEKILRHRLLNTGSFLYLSRDKEGNFYSNMENYTQANQSIPAPQDKHLFLIQKHDPHTLISSLAYNDMNRFINNMSEAPMLRIWAESGNGLFHGTSYHVDNFFENLTDDLIILKHEQILPARLAVIIYRIALLDIEATTTKVGRYFNEHLGLKSKVFYFNHPRIKKTVLTNTLARNKFKAYDLEASEREEKVRREIALSLIRLNLSELDMGTICEVTKLPMSKVKKLKNQLPNNPL
jgi:hypothetical protein